MIVRQAVVSDAEQIAAFWNPVIEQTTVTFSTETKTEAGLAATIAERGPAFQIAEEAGQVLGFATFFPFRSGPGYARTKEHTVILAPEARGRGVGRAVMTAIEAEARGQGVHSLFAGVSAENTAGVAFHAAIGYAEAARLPQVGWKFGRWLDLVLMQKFL